MFLYLKIRKIMPKRKEYSVDMREAVIRALNEGRTQISVSRDFGISRQLVSVWNRRYKDVDEVYNKRRSGRPRKTTIREDKLIKRQSVADPQKSATAIAKDLDENYGINVHISTIKRRLKEQGLIARRPSKKPLISKRNREARIMFAKTHQNWTSIEWSKVLWSDESKFNLFSSDGIKYVRRPKNERYNIRYQVPTVKHGGGNVMVWG